MHLETNECMSFYLVSVVGSTARAASSAAVTTACYDINFILFQVLSPFFLFRLTAV